MREKMKTPRRRAWRHKATAFLLTAALALGWLNFFPQPAKAATINSAADLHGYYMIRMVFDVTNTTTTTVSKAGCEASYIGFASADGQGASFYLNKTICTQKGSYTLADNYLCTSDYGFPPYNTLFKNEMDRTRNFGGTIHVYIYDYINERYVEMTMDDPGKTASVSGQQDLVMNRLHLPEEEYLKYAFIERESTDLTLTGDMTTTYDFPAVTYGSQYGVKRVMKRGYNTVTYELTGYDSKGQALAACGASVNADTGQMTLDPAAALAAGTASVKVTARASFVGQSAAPIAVDHTYNLSYPVVSFDANGGSCTVDQTRMFSGAKIGTLPTPTHTGDVSFAGWYTASSGGDLVTADTPITSSQTLYARWQNNTHAVRYHAGSGTGAPTDNTAYVKDDTVTVRFDQTPTLANHKFLGWATSEGASAPLYRQNGTTSFAMGASDVDLYAVWEAKTVPTAAHFATNLAAIDGETYDPHGNTAPQIAPAAGVSGMGSLTTYYEGINGTAYAKSTTPPVNAGTYQVSADLTEGTDYASISGLVLGSYQIAAAAMTDEVSATGGKYTYDGSARSISVTAPAGASVTYSTDGMSYSAQNPTFTNVTNGPQTVYYLVEKANYESVSGSLTLEITAAAMADEVTATGGKYTYDGTARSISVTAPAGASVTYSTDGVSYSTQNPTFTNVTNGPQTVYYLVEKANYESVSGTLGVEITPRSVVVSGLTVSDKVYDQNTTATPVTQNAVLTGKIASDELTVRVSAHFLDADAGENKPVYFSNMSLTGAKAGNYEIDPASQTSTTATISKALPAAPAANVVSYDYRQETLSFDQENYELFTAAAAGSAVTSGESISGRLGQTLYVRQKEEKNYQPSPFTAVTLPTRPAAPSAVAVDESIDAKADGKITQVDSTMQYSSDGTSWQTVSGTQITSLADGSYYLRRAATDTSLAGEIQTVVIRPGRKLVVTFKAEGSSDITRKVSYGETLLDIPAVPVREGYTQITPMWDVSEFRDLKDDLTVHAIYTINTYPITLFPGEGYTLSAVGSSASPVDHGGSFTFRFSLNQGYDKSDTFAVSVNGTPITLAADGSYTISDIKSATSVSVQGVADITPPTGVLSLGEESWRQLLPAPTWTRYFASAPLITVSGDDNGSGLKEISYYASAEALNSDQLAALPDQSWQSVGAPFSLPAKHGERWIVYAKLTDQWDNAAYLCSEGFTYDLGAPVIDAAPGQTYYGDQRIAINDPNLDQVTLNGEEAVLEEGALFIPAEKNQAYTLIATDKAGNQSSCDFRVAQIIPLTIRCPQGAEAVYDKARVLGYGEDFSFQVALQDGYDQSQVRVYSQGALVAADEDLLHAAATGPGRGNYH